jgi:two-component system phosphate regulon response regulator PhoB
MHRFRTKPVCLVVEPEKGYRELLDDLLSVSDIEVVALSSDAEAVKYLKTDEGAKVQVVLCRAPEPGAKHSLVAKVRNQASTKDLPVLTLSPSNGLQERSQAFELGATEYLVRPVSPVTLAARVMHWSSRAHQPL